ncbi:MAG: hypothetical protein IRZ16_18975 [Myxococcaceae bacterium]|nr:hypothetical protein [Myxococcaceae bacterium]
MSPHRRILFPFACAVGLCAVAARGAGGTEAGQAPGGVIDRVVAVVQLRAGSASRSTSGAEGGPPPEVITLSGLDFEARVALIQRGAVRAATEPLDEETLRRALENAINERLLAGEAEVLGAWRVEPAEVDAALRAFRDELGSDAALKTFLARHEADIQALERVLERHLRAARVIDSKVRLRAQVADSEVKRYFDEHRGEFSGTFEEVRPLLREKLYRERAQQLVDAELAQLRRTHEVRRVAPFAQGAGKDAE